MSAILFDLDGTIMDSLSSIIHIMRLTLDDLEIAGIEDNQIKAFIGIPLVQIGKELRGEQGYQKFVETYHFHYCSSQIKVEPFAGMRQYFTGLKNDGIKTAIVTAKKRPSTIETLTDGGLIDYFDCLITADSGAGAKPQAGPALAALDQLAELPAEAFFVGDSIHDMACAKNAGLSACGVLWGAASRRELEKAGADYTVENVDQLIILSKEFFAK